MQPHNGKNALNPLAGTSACSHTWKKRPKPSSQAPRNAATQWKKRPKPSSQVHSDLKPQANEVASTGTARRQGSDRHPARRQGSDRHPARRCTQTSNHKQTSSQAQAQLAGKARTGKARRQSSQAKLVNGSGQKFE